MKKVIVALVVMVAAWLVVSLTVRGAKKTAAASEWPMGLGTLESVPRRYARQETNDAARELERLAKTDDAAALRALLLSGEPPVWESDLSRGPVRPTPDVRSLMRVHKMLAANGRGWDDLRAEWVLARSLWHRPEMISSLVALTMTSRLVDRASTLPGPAPAWFEEVRTFDYRRAMLASMQADTWMIERVMKDYAAPDPGAAVPRRLRDQVMAPYHHLSRADFVAYRRAAAVARAKGEVPPEVAWWNRPAMMTAPNLDGAWRRLTELETKLKR